MPSQYIVRPIEANLNTDSLFVGKITPYCSFKLGEQVAESTVCKNGGTHPHWKDVCTIPVSENQGSLLQVNVINKHKASKGEDIGSLLLDLKEVQSQGAVSKWYPLVHGNQPAGKILLETVFIKPSPITEDATVKQEITVAPVKKEVTVTPIKEEVTVTPVKAEVTVTPVKSEVTVAKAGEVTAIAPTNDKIDLLKVGGEKVEFVQTAISGLEHENKIYKEQVQIIEPHTFTKELDIVKIVPETQEIETMVPVKVMKDVEYTKLVSVIKEVEVVEPQVVKKMIEVIEPRVVTKTIQVVENVPVMREVEVIEPKTVIKRVETYEPKTFHKQVEVTEYVPETKKVQVSKPVHIKKNVEYVEPVITIQTITKEVREPIIVNEEVETCVGPATLVGLQKKAVQGVVVEKKEEFVVEKKVVEEKLLAEKTIVEPKATI